jgi:hypothetical protein
MRVDKVDIGKFEVRKGEGMPSDIARVYSAIGPFGQPVQMGDSSALAYTTSNPLTGKVSWFALKATIGTHILGRFFDPDCHMAEPRKNFAFFEVEKEKWEHYVTYLKTRNTTYLRYAERV